jgi:hypothetical protein
MSSEKTFKLSRSIISATAQADETVALSRKLPVLHDLGDVRTIGCEIADR